MYPGVFYAARIATTGWRDRNDMAELSINPSGTVYSRATSLYTREAFFCSNATQHKIRAMTETVIALWVRDYLLLDRMIKQLSSSCCR